MNYESDDVKSIHLFAWPFRIVSDLDRFKIKIKGNGWKNKNMDFASCEKLDRTSKNCFMVNQYLSSSARNIFVDSIGICEVYFLEIDHSHRAYYEIMEGFGNKEYELSIDIIELHIYKFGAGILIIRTCNTKHTSIDEIKKINDLGRRVKLPFIPEEPDEYILCADKLTLCVNGKEKSTDFRNLIQQPIESSREKLLKPAEFLYHLLDGTFTINSKGAADGLCEDVVPAADDRMFLVSLIKDNKLSHKLKQEEEWEDNGFKNLLYELIYADPAEATCQNSGMRDSLLERALYKRWTGYGTVYGVTNYSMLCLTSQDKSIMSSVIRPFVEEYIFFASLVLAQRIGLTIFSAEAGRFSSGVEQQGYIGKKKIKELMNLQERYVTYENQILILEASSQDQGIEIYRLLQKQLLIDEEKQILDNQLSALFDVVNADKGAWSDNFSIKLAIGAIIVDVLLNIFNFCCTFFCG